MKDLLREPDPIRLGHLRSILESRGIRVWVRYENESDVLGINRFELSKYWPVLCVVDDSDHETALEILRQHRDGDEALAQEEVTCAACGEACPANFELCWNCGEPIADPPR